MAYVFRNYDHDDRTQALAQRLNDQAPFEGTEWVQLPPDDDYQQPPNAYDNLPNQTAQTHQHRVAAASSSQWQNAPPDTSRTDFESVYPEAHFIGAPGSENYTHMEGEMHLHGQHALMLSQACTDCVNLPPVQSSLSHAGNPAHFLHHHHSLPQRHMVSEFDRIVPVTRPYSAEKQPQSSVVGNADMPTPAARPTGPKLKFTPEDDALLLELKETKGLTWKQIADFFPGRSSGTLQVRYCTKLKAKDMIWTDPLLDRLRQAVKEYERDRWRIVSGKVGNGFSAAACKNKAEELNEGPAERRDLGADENGHLQS